MINRYLAWKHKRAVIVATPSSDAGQQAVLALPLLPGMRADFRDIRFSDIQGRRLFYAIQSQTATMAIVWIKLPANDKKIFLYYGNGQVASASDGDNTFEFFDNFKKSSVINASKWSVYGTAVISGGQLKLGTTSSTSSEVKGLVTFGQGYRTIIRASVPANAGQFAGVGFLKLNNPGFNGGVGWVTYGTAPLFSMVYDSYTTRTSTANYSAAFHVFDITRLGSGNSKLVIDGSTIVASQASSRTDVLPVAFREFDANKYVLIDYCFVVKHVATPPTLSLGPKFLTQPKTYTTTFNSLSIDTGTGMAAGLTSKEFLPLATRLGAKAQKGFKQPAFYRPAVLGPYHAWKYKGDIRIRSPSDSAGQQAEIIIPVLPGMAADFRDLRISDIRGHPLPFWIDIRTPGILNIWNIIDIWVKLPANDTKIYFYYGNGAAVNVSDGSGTFEFFDDFSGSGDPSTARWDVVKKGSSSATVTLYGDCLQLAGAPGVISSGNAISKQTFSRPLIINYRDKIDNTSYPDTTVGSGALQDWAGGQNDWWHPYQANSYGFMINDGAGLWFIDKAASGAAKVSLRTGNEGLYPALNTFYSHSVILSATDIIYKKGDTFESQTILGSVSDSSYTNNLKIHFGQGEYSNGAGGNRYIDRVFVIKYAAPLPLLTYERHYPQQPATYAYYDRVEVSTATGAQAGLVAKDLKELRDFDTPQVDIRKSTQDAFWQLNADFASTKAPREESIIKFIAHPAGGDVHLFSGTAIANSPTLSAGGNTMQMQAADAARNLVAQHVPWDAHVITISGEVFAWPFWIVALVEPGATNVHPMNFNDTDMPDKQFIFEPKTTRLEAINQLSEYCGMIFHTKWFSFGGPSDLQKFVGAYWVPPADIDQPVNGFDLPAPIELAWPDAALIDQPTLTSEPEEKYNSVTIYGTLADLDYYSVRTAVTPEVADGTVAAREFYLEDNDIISLGDPNIGNAAMQAEAIKWLVYLTAPHATVSLRFVEKYGLELYQRLRFGAGFDESLLALTAAPSLASCRVFDPRDLGQHADVDLSGVPRPAWLRITEIKYSSGSSGNITEIKAVVDYIYSNVDPIIPPPYNSYISAGYLKPAATDSVAQTQVIVANELNKHTSTVTGTALAIDGKTVTILTADGRTITAQAVQTLPTLGSQTLAVPDGKGGFFAVNS